MKVAFVLPALTEALSPFGRYAWTRNQKGPVGRPGSGRGLQPGPVGAKQPRSLAHSGGVWIADPTLQAVAWLIGWKTSPKHQT